MLGGQVVVAALAAALLLAGGCEAPVPPPDLAPSATLGFTQLLPKEGTRHALLRVTNTGEAALDVTSVGIEWPGYPDGTPSPADPTIPASATLDIQLELPDPACEPPGSADVIGVVQTEQGTVRRTLVPTGTTYVRRLWRTQCEDLAARRAVAISYSDSWQVVGSGVDARALGDLVLRRRQSEESIEVEGVDGSVLHGLRLPGRTTLAAGDDVARIPLEITPGDRCDEHARGQATAPFDFLMRLRIGDHAPIAHAIELPLTAMETATEALDIACAHQ